MQCKGWKGFHTGADLVLPLSPEVVEGCDVGVHVVDVVGVRGVVHLRPLLGGRHVRVKHRVLRLGLVVHGVEPDDVLEETVELGVRGWVDGDFEQGPEQIICRNRISFIVLHIRDKPSISWKVLTPPLFL